jgi:hypothetical protein
MPDYFPLVKGAVREYATENSRGAGAYIVEVLDVTAKGGVTTAKCRRTVRLPQEPETVAEFVVTSDPAGVRDGDDVEFNHPVKVGTEWVSSPRRTWIESLDAAVETPAGKFAGCMRVAYLIAEGDGGSGERFYAPGVGLVKVVDNDEGEPLSFSLVKKVG